MHPPPLLSVHITVCTLCNPAAPATVASFYDIATAAGVALSHLLAANPGVNTSTTLQEFLADGLDRPIRVPSFCQVPSHDEVQGYTAAPCHTFVTTTVQVTCTSFVSQNGAPLTVKNFPIWNPNQACVDTTLAANTRFCVNYGAQSEVSADYTVPEDCIRSYRVQPRDSCAFIAAAASIPLTTSHVVRLNTLVLPDNTTRSESL